MDSRVKITKTCKKRIIRYARLIKFLEDSVSVVALERVVKKAKNKATCSQSPGLNKERVSKEWKELSQLTNERTNTSANN